MATGDVEVYRRQLWIDIAVLLAVCAVLFFSLLGDRPLWDIDEGMHAHTSKEMVLTGDWVTPRMNGETFYDKPPLFSWLVALSFLVFGFSEFAARLPAAVLGTATVLATYALGRAMFDRMVGLLGGVVLASSLEFLVMSRVVVHDISLAFTVTLSLLLFWLAFHDDDRRRAYLLGFYVAAGFAVVAKGPLGLVLVGLVVGPWLVVRRRLGFLKDMQLWWGLPVFLAVAAPWYVAVMRANADFGAYFFIQQNFMNFASAESRHPEAWHFYLPVMLGGFFPWTAFLPVAVARAVHRRRDDSLGRFLYLALWGGMPLLFFSVASSKLPSYVLPLFPGLALLVAVYWRDLLTDQEGRLHRGALVSVVVLALILALGLAYGLAFELADAQAKYRVDASVFLVPIAVLAAGVTLTAILCWRRLHRACFATVAGMIAVLILVVNLVVVPAFNTFRSTRELGELLDRVLPEGQRLVFYDDLRDSTLFYTPRLGTVLETRVDVMLHMARPEPAHCVLDVNRFESADPIFWTGTWVVASNGAKLVLANRPTLDDLQ